MRIEDAKGSLGLLDELSGDIRPEDIDAMKFSGVNLYSCVLRSEKAWIVSDETGLLGVGGVRPTPYREGVVLRKIGEPWALIPVSTRRKASDLLRASKLVHAKMLEEYHLLTGWVAESNIQSRRWLAWLGFLFGEPERVGAFGAAYRRFWMRGAA